jgi:putative DNA primase/helicase
MTTMVEFLRHVLPEEGFYVGWAVKGKGADEQLRQRAFDTVEALATQLKKWEAQDFTIYYACASFHSKTKILSGGKMKLRCHENVAWLRDLRLDIDTQESHANAKYADIPEAGDALFDFCDATGMPDPFIVVSGGGLYGIWTLVEPLTLEVWVGYAMALKTLCVKHGLHADPARTADASSVLRPVGALHRKTGRIVKCDELVGPFRREDLPLVPAVEPALLEAKRVKAPKGVKTTRVAPLPSSLVAQASAGLNPAAPAETMYEVEKLCSLLNHVGADGMRTFDPDCAYDEWCNTLMAIAATGWEYAPQIADAWSSQAETEGRYPGADAVYAKMATFTRERGPDAITERSLYQWATERGWKEPLPSREAQMEQAAGTMQDAVDVALQEDEPKTPGARSEYYATDLGNAKQVVARYGADICFVPERKCWFVWDGTRWCIDDDGAVMRLAKSVTVEMLREAASLDDSDKRDRQVKHALKCQAAPRLAAMVMLASTEAEVVMRFGKLDADPLLLGVKNGVIDLRTGKFREARREDFITRQADVVFDPEATCPNWDAFQAKITAGDNALIAYKQRSLGYCLTGLVVEEKLFIWWGTGSNGKSTERETIYELMGDYAGSASAELLIEKRNDGGATPEVARLKGLRIVMINETNQGAALNEERVKFVTGHDTITARYLHENPFDFYPTHKIILTTNHKPIVKGADRGLWRRLHLWPYTVTIPEDEAEKEFREKKLIPEMSGILNRLLEGLRAYLREGLNPPETVQCATDAYRQDMDIIAQWIDARCTVHPEATVVSKEAFDDYDRWARGEFNWALSSAKFYRDMAEREGITSGVKVRGNKGMRGLRLNEPRPLKDERTVLAIIEGGRPARSGAEAVPGQIKVEAVQKVKVGEGPKAPFSPVGS